ncbi:MAG: alpha/beta fold hydrolase, partial [Burkholderiales bacterium]
RGQTTFSEKRGLTPILFVHGLSFFSWDWVDVAAALGADREAVCIDMRGFGDSGWSAAKDYSVPSMAQDLANLMDHLEWPRAILAGHSMGGRSAAYLAATQPARAAALVLVDYSPDNAPAGSARVAQTVAATPDAFASIDEAMRYFKAGPGKRARFEAYLRPVEGGYALKRDPHFRNQFRKILASGERPKLGVDMWQTLTEVRCPVLAIRGARSDLFARETVAKLEAANPRIHVAEVDAGHNVAGDNPQGFVAALALFLDSLEETDHEHTRH